MKHTVTVVTGPSYEPVALAEAKRWLRIEAADTDHDQVVALLIKALRIHAENLTLRAFIPRTLCLRLEAWPQDQQYGVRIPLPFPPLISVSAVQYRDIDGVLTTLASTEYEVHEEHEPGLIIPSVDSDAWPSVLVRPDGVQVTYRAGYTPGSPDDENGHQEVIPAELRVWMETRIATLFEQREQLVIGTNVMPLAREYTDALLDSLVIGDRVFG